MYDYGDVLLFVLSAGRETTWSAFKRAFDHVHGRRLRLNGIGYDGSTRFERSSALRLLASLSHCDFDFSSGVGRIVTAPAVLAALPTPGLPRAILCGPRSPETFSIIRHTARSRGRRLRVEVRSQQKTAPYAPSRLEVEAASDEELHDLASTLGISYIAVPPAWTISQLSGSLDQYMTSLRWSAEPELRWEREDFDIERLRFTKARMERPPVRLSRYQDPVRLRWVYRLWREGSNADVDQFWGRYAILKETARLLLLYDEQKGEVGVPRGAPLPLLPSRGLTLSSGFVPRFIDRSALRVESGEQVGFDVYAGVSVDLLEIIASKLGHVQVQHLALGGTNA